MTSTDVCITGVGAATPLGQSYQSIAECLLEGRSGVRRITAFGVDDHASQIAGLVGDIPRPEVIEESEFASLPEVDRLALWCCDAALRDAGWWARRSDIRVGIVLGTAAEWTSIWEMDGLSGGDQLFRPQQDRESLVHRTRQRLQLSGPGISVSAACASGNYALALARRWLRMGWVDVCLAGGCDMAVTPMTLAGFSNLRAVSRRNHDPAAASRPFDTERDGFVIGEGGAMFVLESAASARQRSARIYAVVSGFGASSDAFHMVIPSSDPGPAIAAVRMALADARLDATDVDYVNAHATSTSVGDIAEARVLEAVLGAAIEVLPVSSTKSMTGHLLTGAAAMEALACLVAMDRNAVPPTINLHNPDPDCRLCHVPNQAQQHRVRAAISNSFGFGGSNTCVVFRAA